MSSVEMIEHFTGFGLYDKTFIKLLKELDDPIPFIRGVVAEYGYRRKDIEYEQPNGEQVKLIIIGIVYMMQQC